MQVFYTNDIQGDFGSLHGQESIHCIRVLRHKVGDKINVVDGRGAMFESEILRFDKEHTEFQILHADKASIEATLELPTIAFGIIKNDTRTEWMMEKLVEIGVARLTPLICDHSEKRRLRTDRLNRIMVSAMKQSKRRFLPILDSPVSFASWIEACNGESTIIAHYNPDHPGLSQLANIKGPITLVVGPEGDFSQDEIDRIHNMKLTRFNLSKYRLRTETAAIVGCTLLNSQK